MATINDVCKLAGVSKATVSRVINGTGQVKPATRSVVTSAMEELGYHPNVLARALATNSSNAIGLALPHFESSYFGTVMVQATQATQNAGKKLLVMDSQNHAEGEKEAVLALATQRCDAIVLYSRHLNTHDLTSLQDQLSVPLIVLNRFLPDTPLHSFGLDQNQLATLAVQHLLDLGHRSIAYITSPMQSDTGRIRYSAYESLLQSAQIERDCHLVVQGENSLESGYRAVVDLLAAGRSFTAIFACNDDMAIGAIRALYDHGIRVPQDVSVVGIDNEPQAAYAIPSLSTVSLPIQALTADAMKLALTDKATLPEAPVRQQYTGELVIRESTQIREFVPRTG